MTARKVVVELTEKQAEALWSFASMGATEAYQVCDRYQYRAGIVAMQKLTEAQHGKGARRIGDHL